MKLIYIVILFMVFFNIFVFMFGYMNIFGEVYEGDSEHYNINESADQSNSEGFVEDVSDMSFGDVMYLFFGEIEGGNILGTVLTLGGALFLAWLTRSPAPFVLGFLANFMRVTYTNSMDVFEQMPTNGYMMLAGTVGMIFLFIITSAEYLTHGDA